MKFKEGSGWKACHHEAAERFFGEYGGIQAYHLYELTKEQYDLLDNEMTEYDAAKIMSDGRHLYMSVDDRCGPPYTIVFDDDYEKLCSWAKVMKSGRVWPDELTDAAVELFESEKNNREQRRRRREMKTKNYRFMELVEREQGFEYYQAFRDEVDWIIGGKGDTFWFVIMKDQAVKETYVGTFRDGEWTDRRIKGKKKTVKEMSAGSTIKRIEKRAYFMQDESWVKDRKPRLIEDAHPHYHYVYGIGDKALDVSEAYGVSIGYSDLQDPEAGFHLRYLYTGKDVESPV